MLINCQNRCTFKRVSSNTLHSCLKSRIEIHLKLVLLGLVIALKQTRRISSTWKFYFFFFFFFPQETILLCCSTSKSLTLKAYSALPNFGKKKFHNFKKTAVFGSLAGIFPLVKLVMSLCTKKKEENMLACLSLSCGLK